MITVGTQGHSILARSYFDVIIFAPAGLTAFVLEPIFKQLSASPHCRRFVGTWPCSTTRDPVYRTLVLPERNIQGPGDLRLLRI